MNRKGRAESWGRWVLRIPFLHRFSPPPEPEDTRARTGREGENAAAGFLRREKGMKVLERNWRHGRGEIDLIARDREVLVFVEVRSRRTGALVSGYDSVNREKKRVLRRTARAYLRALRTPARHFRFDIIEVRHSDGKQQILHYENVRLFSKHD